MEMDFFVNYKWVEEGYQVVERDTFDSSIKHYK